MAVCKRVVYSGRVQGVGFRATAWHVAQQFRVAGHVRNLADGTVELVAEGPAEQVEAFLAAVAGKMAWYITHSDVHDEGPTGAREFGIRHGS
jgi:acylphosphatase